MDESVEAFTFATFATACWRPLTTSRFSATRCGKTKMYTQHPHIHIHTHTNTHSHTPTRTQLHTNRRIYTLANRGRRTGVYKWGAGVYYTSAYKAFINHSHLRLFKLLRVFNLLNYRSDVGGFEYCPRRHLSDRKSDMCWFVIVVVYFTWMRALFTFVWWRLSFTVVMMKTRG